MDRTMLDNLSDAECNALIAQFFNEASGTGLDEPPVVVTATAVPTDVDVDGATQHPEVVTVGEDGETATTGSGSMQMAMVRCLCFSDIF